MWIQSENDKKKVLYEEKQFLGLEEKEDYKVFENDSKINRKRTKKN